MILACDIGTCRRADYSRWSIYEYLGDCKLGLYTIPVFESDLAGGIRQGKGQFASICKIVRQVLILLASRSMANYSVISDRGRIGDV